MKLTFTHKGWLMGFCPVVFSNPGDDEQDVLFTGRLHSALGYVARSIAWLLFLESVPVLFISKLDKPLEVDCEDPDDDGLSF